MRKWTLITGLSALALMGMGATPRYLEELRIGGGYHEAADGGADFDKAGNISTDGSVVADGGLEAGREGAARGVATAWDGSGGDAPGCLRLGTANGSEGYVFLSNDRAGLRVSATLPAADTDGAYLACGKYRGTGSATDAVDLGTAEVSGTLPASKVGNGITDAQIADNLTVVAGAINDTPVGAAVASTGRFTSLQATGDLQVDGGDIGISSDADLIGLGPNAVTVRGTLASGIEDTTTGVLRLYGDNASTGGWIALENGANLDSAIENWTVGCGLFGTFAIGGHGGTANLGNVFTINSGSGHAYFAYDATVQGGFLNVGATGVQRGMVSAFASGGAPGCLRMGTANGSLYHVFASNDGAGLRISPSAPTSDTDGTWIASGVFRGTGSTTDAVDLGTAEVAGTLAASKVGNGLTDAQVSDALTINGGTINNTAIGAASASTGVFSRLTVQGALVTSNIMNVTVNDTTPDVANTHLCRIPNT
ncbi:MAG TPA: hypothetical protein PLI07_05985, partial [Candidatus Hydrogenedentes bacterium]|nr:hypothetical protein [Candidatus Hydrogenedentota bacterium]